MARISTLLALWVIAAVHRLEIVQQAILSSDALGPYLQAQAFLFGHIPRPPNPESGDALWFLAMPLVALADNLHELFTLRFVVGASVAPLAFLGAWHWTDDTAKPARRWAAAIAAGLFAAFDPGLLDTLISGARSYGAPELIGVTTVGLAMAIKGHPWALPMTIISGVLAAGHHPLALGAFLGILSLLPRIHRELGWRRIRLSLIIGAIVAVPRLIRIGAIAFCGEGIGPCIAKVARSNVTEPEPWLTMLSKAVHDRWLVDLGAGTWIIVAGLAALLFCRSSDHRKASHFALWATAGVLILGAFNGYIRSYHLRILAVPFAIAAGMGLARVWPLAVLATGVFAFRSQPLIPVGPDPGAIERHDLVVQHIGSGPVWVDRVWWDGPIKLDPSGVVLSGWLSGRRDFVLTPTGPMVILQSGEQPGPKPIVEGAGWSVLKFDGAEQDL